MKVIVLGTNHDVQEKDYKGTNEFRRVLEYVIRVWQPQVVMEEWTSTKGSTVGQRLVAELKLKRKLEVEWANVGTPSQPKFETLPTLFDPLETPPMVLNRYGSLDVQMEREEYMLNQLAQSMQGMECGLFIVGLAHLHSMSEKLLARDFEVEVILWTTPDLRL